MERLAGGQQGEALLDRDAAGADVEGHQPVVRPGGGDDLLGA